MSFGIIDVFFRGEDYENPCIYVGKSKDKGEIPTHFELIEGSPLMDKPLDIYGLGSYCSDPDLFVFRDNFIILNRNTFRKSETGIASEDYENQLYLIEGKVDNNRFITQRISYLFSDQDLSPCFSYYNGEYILLSLDTTSYNTGEICKSLNLRRSKNDFYSWGQKRVVNIDKGKYEPWHMSVFSYQDELYTVVACIKKGEPKRCWQILGKFDKELTSLKLFQTPLTDYISYRGSAVVREDGEFVFYNTTVFEKIRNGKSVDGREVIMAHMPFLELIEKLEKLDER